MEVLSNIPNFLLVLAGFTFIIFIHELGHFVAAKWAGIRVLAFAIGFGPAVASYRKGLGFRRGSSETEYFNLKHDNAAAAQAISPTEYRWNWLPFGGYVKMLGQEDINPNAISGEPDSYQNCVPWKRMVVISAGVVFNVILALALFILVFMVGITFPPAKAGGIDPGSPAALAMPLNAQELKITAPGIRNDDEVLLINGHKPYSFVDIPTIVALADKSEPVELRIHREGFAEPLQFAIKPTPSQYTGMLELGIDLPLSNTLFAAHNAKEEAEIRARLTSIGLDKVRPGMQLVSAAGKQIANHQDVQDEFDSSGGRPVAVTFGDSQGEVTQSVVPRTQLQGSWTLFLDNKSVQVSNLMGLMPVMKIGSAQKPALEQGLRDGDMFVRLGDAEFPSLIEGMREIRGNAGKTLSVVVQRSVDGQATQIPLQVKVQKDGTIGFGVSDTRDESSIVAMPMSGLKLSPRDAAPAAQFAPKIITSPGTRIAAVNDKPVKSFLDIRSAIHAAVSQSTTGASLKFTLIPPTTVAGHSAENIVLTHQLTTAEIDAINGWSMGFECPLLRAEVFTVAETIVKADSPTVAISMGISETRRMLRSVYITFLRLFQGSIPVEQLHGPVGIAHIGTSIADSGLIPLLLFMAMISVNLAVVNFLPLPIVDGGQFLFLVWEQLRGKPASLQFQNAATLAGLVLIGCMFLLVTYNDIAAFFRP